MKIYWIKYKDRKKKNNKQWKCLWQDKYNVIWFYISPVWAHRHSTSLCIYIYVCARYSTRWVLNNIQRTGGHSCNAYFILGSLAAVKFIWKTIRNRKFAWFYFFGQGSSNFFCNNSGRNGKMGSIHLDLIHQLYFSLIQIPFSGGCGTSISWSWVAVLLSHDHGGGASLPPAMTTLPSPQAMGRPWRRMDPVATSRSHQCAIPRCNSMDLICSLTCWPICSAFTLPNCQFVCETTLFLFNLAR